MKDICEGFWQLEDRYQLLDWELDGIKIWQGLRMYLYYRIAQQTGVLDEPHPEYQRSLLEKARTYTEALLFKNPFLDPGRQDVLIFDHSRKVLVEGEYIDVYTKYFLDDLRQQSVSFRVYEMPHMNRHQTKSASWRKHLDIIHLFFQKYARLIPARITEADRQKIHLVEQAVNRHFEINMELEPLLIYQVRNFKAKYAWYRALLQLKRPKQIYVVVAYANPPLIKAAKDLLIESIEFQHGTFSDYHLGYSFPGGQQNLAYFPDRFLVWDNYWKSMCRLPLPPEQVGVRPFQHLQLTRERYRHRTKNKNQITVISQGVIGRELAERIFELAPELQSFRVMYKLHPSEVKRWRDYPALVKLSQAPNVTILDDDRIALYQLLAESKYVIGVFSTALYEALEFDCKLLLVDLPGIEYMQRLLTLNRARMLDGSLIATCVTAEPK